MISFSKVETIKIDEKILFEDLKYYLFETEVVDNADNYIDIIVDLPEDVQRLIFAKMGAMLIDYAKNGDF